MPFDCDPIIRAAFLTVLFKEDLTNEQEDIILNRMEQIERVLTERVKPELFAHGGNIESVSYVDGVYRYRLLGQCCDCIAAANHMEALLKRELIKVLPDLKSVEMQIASPDAIALAMKILDESKQKFKGSRK